MRFNKARCTNIELHGVQFTNKAEYEKTKHIVKQLEKQGLRPTTERILGIKSMVTGKVSIEAIQRHYYIKIIKLFKP